MKAFEEDLTFSGRRGRAVIVDSGHDWRYVFWEHAQYVGCVDLGQAVWFTPEWCETNSPNDLHCYEPIMDKQLRWSRVEIVESGPARARVKWSYALPDMRYRNFHGDSRAEETYTIYPDGLALREVVLWPGTATNHGGNANLWQMAEWILIQGKGVNPVEELAMPAPFEFSNGRGHILSVPWPLPAQDFEPLCSHYPEVADWSYYVGRVRVKNRPHPFLAFPKNQALFPFMPCNACRKPHPYFNLFPGKDLNNVYKHWPVTDMEDFIEWVPAREAMGTVATHTSFVDVNFSMRRSDADYVPTPDPATTWYMLTGAVPNETSTVELEERVRSSFEPASVEIVRDPGEPAELHRGRVLFEGYDFSVRAYVIRKTGEDCVRFWLRPETVQCDPAFVVAGWREGAPRVSVNGKTLSAQSWRSQRGPDGELIVWISGRFEEATEIAIASA